MFSKRYNTYKKEKASLQLVADLKKVPKGSIVIAAVKDEASKRLKYGARRMFMKMGAKKIWKLGYKKGWAFIGIKGLKKGIDRTGKSAHFGAIFSYVKIA